MEKVVVPQFVADYIEDNYQGLEPDSFDKADLIKNWKNYIDNNFQNAKKWLDNDDNFLTFVVAIATNSYEVEEKKYYWRKKKEYMFSFADGIHQFLNIDSNGVCSFGSNAEIAGYRTNLTETQVRQAVREEDFNKLERVEIDDV